MQKLCVTAKQEKNNAILCE